MKINFGFLAACCLVAAAIPTIPLLTKADEAQAARKHTIRVEGSKGVKLQMLLITKPTPLAGPTRETKMVTIPFEKTIKAASFYVWFDTLDGGQSGNDGDRIEGMHEIDGELQGGGFGGTIKGKNKMTFGFGNL